LIENHERYRVHGLIIADLAENWRILAFLPLAKRSARFQNPDRDLKQRGKREGQD
jgi:hypothetical protein